MNIAAVVPLSNEVIMTAPIVQWSKAMDVYFPTN